MLQIKISFYSSRKTKIFTYHHTRLPLRPSICRSYGGYGPHMDLAMVFSADLILFPGFLVMLAPDVPLRKLFQKLASSLVSIGVLPSKGGWFEWHIPYRLRGCWFELYIPYILLYKFYIQ